MLVRDMPLGTVLPIGTLLMWYDADLYILMTEHRRKASDLDYIYHVGVVMSCHTGNIFTNICIDNGTLLSIAGSS